MTENPVRGRLQAERKIVGNLLLWHGRLVYCARRQYSRPSSVDYSKCLLIMIECDSGLAKRAPVLIVNI